MVKIKVGSSSSLVTQGAHSMFAPLVSFLSLLLFGGVINIISWASIFEQIDEDPEI
jgi:hypothetical protein